MKDYKDKISIDQELYSKIMKRVNKKPWISRRKISVFRYGIIMACVVILLIGIWAVPKMFHDPNVNSLGYQEENLYPLTFNIRSDPVSGKFLTIIHCNEVEYSLTDEQINAVFPNFGLPLIAAATYMNVGLENEIIEVTAVVSSTQPMQIWEETALAPIFYFYSPRTPQIRIGKNRLIDRVIMEFESFYPYKISKVHGVPVTVFMDKRRMGNYLEFRADFMLDDLVYRVTFKDNDKEAGQARLTEVVNRLILGGPADFSAVDDLATPGLGIKQLENINEARLDSDFGTFLPVTVPSGGITSCDMNTRVTTVSPSVGRRVVTSRENSLSLLISFDDRVTDLNTLAIDRSNSSIRWHISTPTEEDLARIVSVDNREKYDLSLYPMPRAESVPKELWEFVFNPVFLAEELTLDVIRARTFWLEEEKVYDYWTSNWSYTRWLPGWRMNFSVLYYDVLVHIYANGPFPGIPDLPEQIWEMLSEVGPPEKPGIIQRVFEQVYFVVGVLILLIVIIWLIRYNRKKEKSKF